MAYFNRPSAGFDSSAAGAGGLRSPSSTPGPAESPSVIPTRPAPQVKDAEGRPVSPAKLAAQEKQKVVDAVEQRKKRQTDGWIEVVVTDPDGHPWTGLSYRAVDQMGREYEGELDENGRLSHKPVEPGDVEVELRPSPKDAAKTKTFVELVVCDQSGEPLCGARLRVTDAEGRQFEGLVPESGLVRLDGVAEGDLDVELVAA